MLCIPGLGPPLGSWAGERWTRLQNGPHLGRCVSGRGRKAGKCLLLPLTHTVTPGSQQLGLAEDGQDGEEGSSHLSWACSV